MDVGIQKKVELIIARLPKKVYKHNYQRMTTFYTYFILSYIYNIKGCQQTASLLNFIIVV